MRLRARCLTLLVWLALTSHAEAKPVRPGIDVFLDHPPQALLGKRLGFITNRSAVDATGKSDIDRLFQDSRFKLVRLFSPEHGLRADQQGRLIDGNDSVTGLPVFSLYGTTKKPPLSSLQDLDALLFDIQDVGARFYTYQSTMALAMQAAKEAQIPFVVLDRPNPINGRAVEGALLDTKLASFVGYYPIPVRHGMTLGELARMYNAAFGIDCDLRVVPLAGWQRAMWFDQTELSWVKPSPAMRSPLTAMLYPGICLFEATNIDCRLGPEPFSKVGARWIDGTRYAESLNRHGLKGVRFEAFKEGEVGGVGITVSDREAFAPVLTGLVMIAEAQRLFPDSLKIEPRGFDQMLGASWIRERLLRGIAPESIAEAWTKDSEAFLNQRKPYLLYP